MFRDIIYAQAFTKFIVENRIKAGKVLSIDKNENCDECIKAEIHILESKQ